ncbi:fla cluster protein FlaF [Halomicrococcus gelatinilyticus]|uniref:fla cluster protein FlaF n=1 Tax=Halomicrococcus gelatinilyticus TaxID=1702103 RepID=UPI002E0E640F
MGFSVSGSTAILFIAMFVSFGVMYTASYNGFERVSDAKGEEMDQMLTQRNTELNITDTSYSGGNLTVTVNNTGSTSLDIEDTDVLVNGSYVTDSDIEARDVDGDVNTTLWLPGETLTVKVNVASPARVKIVTTAGVADTEVL